MHAGVWFGLLLLLTASAVSAIYEEQAGENDWHSEFIGRPLDAQASENARVVVSTALNVLATLSLDTGDIVWRQVFHESDQLQGFTVLSKPAAVISVSSNGTLLRAWRSEDGALLWERYIKAAPQELVALTKLPEASFGSGEGIAVAAGGHIQVWAIY